MAAPRRGPPSSPRLPGKAAAPLAVASALVLGAPPAAAYCRTTTCVPSEEQDCRIDRDGCVADGLPLFWSGGRTTIHADAAGSARRGISGYELASQVRTAFTTWMNADCGEAAPSLHVELPGTLAGAAVEYDPDPTSRNVNAVLFVDDDWPHAPAAVGVTTVTFVASTGRILDADTELNAVHHRLAVDAEARRSEVDLLSVLTHEAGHTLGLDHSSVPGATMQPESRGFGLNSLRVLSPDDMEGICAAYPPGSDALDCECTIPAVPAGRGSRGALLACAGAAAWWLRRRVRRRAGARGR